MKAKGLQKLKFYCQMCQKQCRDANGFKCHLTSENHLRQMKIFSDNAGGILDKYSKEFEQSYLAALRMRHGTKKVNANNVYQELISDKQHIHMNATHWTTLTEFVQYLGKTGKCVVEENERGWFVSYIQRDASILARQEAHRQRDAADRAAEEAQAQRMELQRVEAAKAMDRVGASVNVEATTLERENSDQPIKVALGTSSSVPGKKSKKSGGLVDGFGDDDDEEEEEEEEEKGASMGTKGISMGTKGIPNLPPPPPTSVTSPVSAIKKRPRDDPTKEKQSKKKEMKSDNDGSREDNWLYEGIVVRVINKKLAGGNYFRRKAVVDRLVDKYTAEVEVLDSGADATDGGDVLRLDQQDLETVIPKKDDRKQKVRILKGKYRGCKAKIEYLDKKNYQADLKLSGEDGKRLKNVPYEDISQIST